MTIMCDIIAAMYAAPRKPIGLILGTSGWHAFQAVRASLDLGDDVTRAIMGEINRLSISRTTRFGGFDLILDDTPNTLGGQLRSAAA